MCGCTDALDESTVYLDELKVRGGLSFGGKGRPILEDGLVRHEDLILMEGLLLNENQRFLKRIVVD